MFVCFVVAFFLVFVLPPSSDKTFFVVGLQIILFPLSSYFLLSSAFHFL